ncbi:MAG: TIGR03915 family putative DNA repair protein [Candidatus Omnitrophica bacterium]|nr:TIGR03915 family putative DNA repair protein [Candidatus Omnitrophota bacterium]
MTKKSREVDFGCELHRWKGFARFRRKEDGTLMAFINPECDILSSLAAYFSRRLTGQRWVIVDTRRARAAVCREASWRIVPWQDHVKLVTDSTETLWQTYVDTIAIKERENKKLQHQHIPERYRRHLVENV